MLGDILSELDEIAQSDPHQPDPLTRQLTDAASPFS
jgi:hypothetical protein